MSEYIFVTNIFEYSNIRIYLSHSDLNDRKKLVNNPFKLKLKLEVTIENKLQNEIYYLDPTSMATENIEKIPKKT